MVLHIGDQGYSFRLVDRLRGDVAAGGGATFAGVDKIPRFVPGVGRLAIGEPLGGGGGTGQEKVVDDVAFPDCFRVGADQAPAVAPIVDHIADVLAVGLILGIAALIIDEKVVMERHVAGGIEQKAESLRGYAFANDAILHRDLGSAARELHAIPPPPFHRAMVDDDVGASRTLQGTLALAARHVFPKPNVADDDVAFLAQRSAKTGDGYAGGRGGGAIDGGVAFDGKFRFELDDARDLEVNLAAFGADGVAK